MRTEKLSKQEGLKKENAGSRQVHCLVVRSVFFSYFKDFINQAKKLIVVFLHFKQHIRSNAPVFIGFTFFLILIPFSVKDVSAFPAHFDFNITGSDFLSGEHVVEKLSVFRGGHVRQFSVFEYLNKWHKRSFEIIIPFISTAYTKCQICEQGDQNNESIILVQIHKKIGDEIINNVIQGLMILALLMYIFRTTTK